MSLNYMLKSGQNGSLSVTCVLPQTSAEERVGEADAGVEVGLRGEF